MLDNFLGIAYIHKEITYFDNIEIQEIYATSFIDEMLLSSATIPDGFTVILIDMRRGSSKSARYSLHLKDISG